MHDIKREETSRPVKPRIEYIPPNDEVIERIARRTVNLTTDLEQLTATERYDVRMGLTRLLSTAVVVRTQQLTNAN